MIEPGRVAIRTPVRGWRAAFPPAQWLAAYPAQWLPRDAIAGITLAADGIPVCHRTAEAGSVRSVAAEVPRGPN